jgi:hypothetical protein
MTWVLRWHPFRGQEVLFTSHRDARPWIGEIVVPAENHEPIVSLSDNVNRLAGRHLESRSGFRSQLIGVS